MDGEFTSFKTASPRIFRGEWDGDRLGKSANLRRGGQGENILAGLVSSRTLSPTSQFTLRICVGGFQMFSFSLIFGGWDCIQPCMEVGFSVRPIDYDRPKCPRWLVHVQRKNRRPVPLQNRPDRRRAKETRSLHDRQTVGQIASSPKERSPCDLKPHKAFPLRPAKTSP